MKSTMQTSDLVSNILCIKMLRFAVAVQAVFKDEKTYCSMSKKKVLRTKEQYFVFV